jgi:hypothetical protein
MTLEWRELADKGGATAVLLLLAVGVLIAGLVFLAQSIATWFDDRNP